MWQDGSGHSGGGGLAANGGGGSGEGQTGVWEARSARAAELVGLCRVGYRCCH
jgi:hypothetical protein